MEQFLEKSKPVVRPGRKAMGLVRDSQAAEWNIPDEQWFVSTSLIQVSSCS